MAAVLAAACAGGSVGQAAPVPVARVDPVPAMAAVVLPDRSPAPTTTTTTTTATLAEVPAALVPTTPELGWRALTVDGGTPYRVDAGPAAATVTMPGGGGTANTRIVFWDESVPESVDQLSCATWTGESGPHDQEGAALRIRSTGTGVRAITVTKGVWVWPHVLNVHLWDTGHPRGPPGIAQFDLSPALGVPRAEPIPLPWRLCARVTGRLLELVVWPLTEAQPPWGDRGHGGALILPPGWEEPGRPGWYAGHLKPYDQVGFGDLVASASPPPSSPTRPSP